LIVPRIFSKAVPGIKFIGLLSFALVASLAVTGVLSAADSKLTPEQLDFFEKKVRPVFVDNCYKCHSPDAEKVKGGLLLDTRAGVLKGGDTGPAIVPGNPDLSLLIQAIRYTNKDLQMPPNDRQLENSEINVLETWVKMGAPDPRNESDAGQHKYIVDFDKAKKHWSFQPIVKPAGSPAVRTRNTGRKRRLMNLSSIKCCPKA
jgi:mono/diheme cytochrome c family protein